MTSSANRSVLITGTAGFIGFHLARRLLSEGWLVGGIDGMTPYYDVDLKRRRHAILRQSNAFVGHELMLEDDEGIMKIFETLRPQVVIHLAAQAGVRYSLENPRAYVDSNLIGTFNVIEALRHFKPAHFMLASTSSVYGGNTAMPFGETDRCDYPLTFYAATKKATEAMAHSYSHLWGIPTTVFRFFTVYGPWGRPDMALFKFVRSILSDEPIDIFGHGKMQRDFTYIDDLVEAIVRLTSAPPTTEDCVAAEDSLSPVAPFRTVNIGGGSPVELMQFVEAIEQTLGLRAKRNMLPMQLGDVTATFSDSDLLEAITGFKPKTPIDVGVQRFVSWYLEYYGSEKVESAMLT